MATDDSALMVAVAARLLEGTRHVAVGVASPVPAAAALLYREQSPAPVQVSILGSRAHSAFTNGGVELFDAAAEGRIDAFFLSGGQIDGEGNLNLVGIGDYPAMPVRWAGCFGSPYMYALVPRVILVREEHSPRVLVSAVDFTSAPGASPPGHYRRGGPAALLTPRCLFAFDRARRRFRLESVHPGHDTAEIERETAFAFDRAAEVPETPPPDDATLDLIRGRVADLVAETYPQFARRLLTEARAA